MNMKCIRTWQWEIPSVGFQGCKWVIKAVCILSAFSLQVRRTYACLPSPYSYYLFLSVLPCPCPHSPPPPKWNVLRRCASSLFVLNSEMFSMVPSPAEQNNDLEIRHPVPSDQCEKGSGWPPGTPVVLKVICLLLGWCTACSNGQPALVGEPSCHFWSRHREVVAVLSGAPIGTPW